MMNPLLSIEHLYKSFGDTEVLSDINFTIDEGEMVAIMGQSGSGKSTLLYCLSGMDKFSKGNVQILGQDITNMTDEELSDFRLKTMGFIFQQANLLKDLNVKDNIMLPALHAGDTLSNVEARAEQLMEATGITHIAHHDINEVSGGQLQRATICRALINQPKLLIGDEPTGALNSKATIELMDIMNQINNDETTVILVTHDTQVAVRATRIIYLKDGQIHDELKLSSYDNGVVEERMERLKHWLEEMGF
ncbi:ABC transporter ATP-binding protein [Macrococcus animalis]|uniref:ABC transporter ATP-binding protein n=2 Tax=Macrococcus animalis TaxID=3395467 RepID=UPI0039BECD34